MPSFDPSSATPMFDPTTAILAGPQTVGITPQVTRPALPEPSIGQSAGSYLAGIQQGIYDIPQSVVELGARGTDVTGLTDNAYKNIHEGFKELNAAASPEQPNKYSQGGRIVGNVIGTAPTAAIAPFSGGGVLASAANAGLQGLASSALTSSQSDAPLTEQMETGAGLGLGFGAAGHGAAAVIAPKLSPYVRLLLNEGVQLTPGQLLGGTAHRLEDAATSLPIFGDFIKNRQIDSLNSFNRAAINRSLAPIGEEVPTNLTGHAATGYAADKLGDAYDNLLPNLSATIDQKFTTDIANLKANAVADYMLPQDKADHFSNLIDAQLSKVPTGNFDGEQLKNIQSALGNAARKYGKSPDPDQQSLGDALFDARAKVNDLIARQNPTQAPELTNINEGWANWARIRPAAAKSNTGTFTPSQLATALRGADTSVGHGASATGDALMQDLSTAGNAVLPSSVPDSGTPFRHAVQFGASLLGGHAVAPETTAEIATPLIAGTALGSALYTKPVTSLIRGAIANRPAIALRYADILRQAPFGVFGAGAPAALNYAGAQP